MTMSEKVAQAIAEKVINHDQTFASLEDIARTAIEAMREPTEGMLASHSLGRNWGEGLAGAWRAMIDTALAEDRHRAHRKVIPITLVRRIPT